MGRAHRAPGRRTHRAGYTPAVANAHLASLGRSGHRRSGRLLARSVMLRVFAVSDGDQGWRVLPGGLARVASAGQEITSMQRGGSSADVWAMTRGEVDHSTLLAAAPDARVADAAQAAGHQPRRRKPVLAGPLHRAR